MRQNRHAFRNLGVSCALLRCSRCERETTFSVCLETDAKRRKICSLGCNECGSGGRIDETSYEQLYELSFEFDRLQERKISREAFERLVPDRCRSLFEKMQGVEQAQASDPAPQSASASPIPSTSEPAKSWPKPGAKTDRFPEVVLTNATSDTLGFAIMLAILAGAGLFIAGLLLSFPAWARGGVLLAAYFGCMASGFIGGYFLSYKRFPRSVRLSDTGLEVVPRGKSQTLRYELSDVSRVNYGAGAKFLTLWMGDGNTFVVRVPGERVTLLESYFGDAR